jgi:hypothetical protein
MFFRAISPQRHGGFTELHREIPFPGRMLATNVAFGNVDLKTEIAARKEPAALSQIKHFYPNIGDY